QLTLWRLTHPQSVPNANSALLETFIQSRNLVGVNGSLRQRLAKLLTFFGPNGRTTRLDWILCPFPLRSRVRKVINIRPRCVASDHSLVACELNLSWTRFRRPPPKPLWADLRNPETRTDFLTELSNASPAITETAEAFANAVGSAASVLPRQIGHQPRALWDCDAVIATTRRSAQSAAARHGEDSDQARLARDNLQATYAQRTELFIEEAVQEIQAATDNCRHTAAWRAINRLTGRRPRPTTVVGAESIEQRKSLLVDHYRQVLNAPSPTSPLLPAAGFTPAQHGDFYTGPITAAEATKALKSMRADAASGVDRVPPRVLKLPELTDSITSILNKYCCLGGDPAAMAAPLWRTSRIVSIPKKDASTSLDNQRALAYADDIALLCRDPVAAQHALTRLSEEGARIGLQINTGKTEVLHVGADNAPPLTLPNGEAISTCSDFRYLGTLVMSPEAIIADRRTQAWRAMHHLRPIFTSGGRDDLKIHLFRAAVEPILLHGMEAVPMTTTRERALDAMHRNLLRKALGVRYPTVLSTAQLMARSKSPSLSATLRRRRQALLGHCLRRFARGDDNPLGLAILHPPTERFRRGQGRTQTLRETLVADLEAIGLTPQTAATCPAPLFCNRRTTRLDWILCPTALKSRVSRVLNIRPDCVQSPACATSPALGRPEKPGHAAGLPTQAACRHSCSSRLSITLSRMLQRFSHGDRQTIQRPCMWDRDLIISQARRHVQSPAALHGHDSGQASAARDELQRIYAQTEAFIEEAPRPNTIAGADSTEHRKALQATHYREVDRALRTMRADAAAGVDAIPPRVLKLPELTSIITCLLNKHCSLGGNETTSAPQQRRTSKIFFIPKKGASTSLDNQRGIALEMHNAAEAAERDSAQPPPAFRPSARAGPPPSRLPPSAMSSRPARPASAPPCQSSLSTFARRLTRCPGLRSLGFYLTMVYLLHLMDLYRDSRAFVMSSDGPALPRSSYCPARSHKALRRSERSQNGGAAHHIAVCEDFRYLGALVMSPDAIFSDMRNQAWRAAHLLRNVFNLAARDELKVRLFRAAVEPILLYGMVALYRALLRYALGVHYPERLPTNALTEQLRRGQARTAALTDCLIADLQAIELTPQAAAACPSRLFRERSAPLAFSGVPASEAVHVSTGSGLTPPERALQTVSVHVSALYMSGQFRPMPATAELSGGRRQRFGLEDGSDRTEGRPGKSSAPPEVFLHPSTLRRFSLWRRPMRLRSRKPSLAEGSAVRSTQSSSSSTKRNGTSVSPCKSSDDLLRNPFCSYRRYGSSTDCRQSSSSRLKSSARCFRDFPDLFQATFPDDERKSLGRRSGGHVVTNKVVGATLEQPDDDFASEVEHFVVVVEQMLVVADLCCRNIVNSTGSVSSGWSVQLSFSLCLKFGVVLWTLEVISPMMLIAHSATAVTAPAKPREPNLPVEEGVEDEAGSSESELSSATLVGSEGKDADEEASSILSSEPEDSAGGAVGHCVSASVNLMKIAELYRPGLILIQEPWMRNDVDGSFSVLPTEVVAHGDGQLTLRPRAGTAAPPLIEATFADRGATGLARSGGGRSRGRGRDRSTTSSSGTRPTTVGTSTPIGHYSASTPAASSIPALDSIQEEPSSAPSGSQPVAPAAADLSVRLQQHASALQASHHGCPEHDRTVELLMQAAAQLSGHGCLTQETIQRPNGTALAIVSRNTENCGGNLSSPLPLKAIYTTKARIADNNSMQHGGSGAGSKHPYNLRSQDGALGEGSEDNAEEASGIQDSATLEGANLMETMKMLLTHQSQQLQEMTRAQERQSAFYLEQLARQQAEFTKLLAESKPRPQAAEPKLFKLTDSDDIEAFLMTFERAAASCGWQKSEWTIRLAPLLTGVAQSAFHSLTSAASADYDLAKATILARYNIGEETYRQRFRSLRKAPEETFQVFATKLEDLFVRWMTAGLDEDQREELISGDSIVRQKVLLEQFTDSLTRGLQVWMRERKPKDIKEAAKLADDYAMARNSDKGGGTPGHPSQETSEGATASNAMDKQRTIQRPQSLKPKISCFNCGGPHKKFQCTNKPANVHLASEERAMDAASGRFITGHADGKELRFLMDTGADRTTIRRSCLPENINWTGHHALLRCFGGDLHRLPIAKVELHLKGYNRTTEGDERLFAEGIVASGLNQIDPEPAGKTKSRITRAQARKQRQEYNKTRQETAMRPITLDYEAALQDDKELQAAVQTNDLVKESRGRLFRHRAAGEDQLKYNSREAVLMQLPAAATSAPELSEHLTPAERDRLLQLVQDFAGVFSEIPGRTDLVEHQAGEERKTEQKSCFARCWERCCACLNPPRQYLPRVVFLGRPSKTVRYPPNRIRNQKYSVFSFVFLVLFEQFKLFLNFCFLVMALSQFIPPLRIGYLYTYWGPLGFVVFVTMVREAVDDFRRWRRDRELNGTVYERLARGGSKLVPSSVLQVGDVIRVNKNERVPADLVLLRTSEKQGTCYLRTDQLDGETDWKLRVAPPTTQRLSSDEELLSVGASVYAERPGLDIHSFIGTLSLSGPETPDSGSAAVAGDQASLSVENTLWTNTVVASNWAVGVVVYTGAETRAAMNSTPPRSKFGLVDREINNVTKLLVASVLLLSMLMVALKGFGGQWYKYYWRFLLLFSYIIPLALRVNLDMAKITYSFLIMRDEKLEGNIVRNTTIPEE
uniref:Reverse transcriptase domain-containing protein n=1 Tax=Macrostomum lignano TaxID=282301 RepID=A0A1I8HIG2_9PLAT